MHNALCHRPTAHCAYCANVFVYLVAHKPFKVEVVDLLADEERFCKAPVFT